jgi:NH3-dependent NAD+ synthetase
MSRLAKKIQAAIKHALEIHSPSRVMHRLGAFTGLGFKGGLDSTHAAVAASAARMGRAATNVRTYLTGGSYSAAGRVRDVHLHTSTTEKPSRQAFLEALGDYNALHPGAAIVM